MCASIVLPYGAEMAGGAPSLRLPGCSAYARGTPCRVMPRRRERLHSTARRPPAAPSGGSKQGLSQESTQERQIRRAEGWLPTEPLSATCGPTSRTYRPMEPSMSMGFDMSRQASCCDELFNLSCEGSQKSAGRTSRRRTVPPWVHRSPCRRHRRHRRPGRGALRSSMAARIPRSWCCGRTQGQSRRLWSAL